MPVKLTKVEATGTELVSHLARTLHLTADDQVVEEDDPTGVKVLGGAGLAVNRETIEKYGLSTTQLEQEPTVEPEPPPEGSTDPMRSAEAEAETTEKKRGRKSE